MDDFVFDTDIGFDRDGLGPRFTDLSQHPLGSLIVVQIVDADTIAFTCGQTCSRRTNTPAGAGNHNDLVHQFSLPQ
ncbi:hypothetical protein D3C71_1956670 [compost metagenome]